MEHFFVLNSENKTGISDGFLGNVFFYQKSKDELIATTQLSLIEKLIENGLKLELENVLIVDINEQKIGLNFTLKKYHIQSINNVQFLKADIAEILDKNAALKTKFWNELKKLFNI